MHPSPKLIHSELSERQCLNWWFASGRRTDCDESHSLITAGREPPFEIAPEYGRIGKVALARREIIPDDQLSALNPSGRVGAETPRSERRFAHKDKD